MSVKTMFKNLGNQVGRGFRDQPLQTLFITSALGYGAKHGIIDPMKEKSKIRKSKKLITDRYPNLATEDPKKIKRYFDVVKEYSPKAASNPLVAGSIVNRMNQYGGVDHKLVQDLVGIESGHPATSAKNEVAKGAYSAAARMV